MKCAQIRERIKRARRSLGYTQEQMAEALKISTNSYREIESGNTTLINPRLPVIAQILNLSMESLIFGHVPKEESLETIKRLEKDYRTQIRTLITNHKIEIAEKEGEINILKTSLQTKDRIIGVLNEKDEDY